MNRNKHRGIIHFHSGYSYDSICTTTQILRFSRKQKLDFLILTDHETIKGNEQLRRMAAERNLELEIPLAAEYRTNLGDVIAAFLQREIITRDFDELILETKRQGGICMFPHPYSGHSNIEHIASHVDLIEVYNSRQTSQKNVQASQLAEKYQKPTYYSPDAHWASELGNAIVECGKQEDLKNDLLTQQIDCLTSKKTSYIHTRSTRLIRALKMREYSSLLKIPFALGKDLFKSI